MTTHSPRTGRSTAARRLIAVAIAVAGAAPVSAQQAPRMFISVNGGLQASTRDFSQDVVFPETGRLYREVLSLAAAEERARFESSHRFRTGMLFDVGAGVDLVRNFGFGIGVSRFRAHEPASVSAQVPHPLFFDRNRSISGTSTPLARSETALHLQARATVPAGESVRVTVFGGPTLFNVAQQLVSDVRFTQEYPYDTARYSSADVRREFGSTTGFNLGADVSYYFSSGVGIGWLVRYSRATVELASAGDGTLHVEVGGVHTAGGLRLRF